MNQFITLNTEELLQIQGGAVAFRENGQANVEPVDFDFGIDDGSSIIDRLNCMKGFCP